MATAQGGCENRIQEAKGKRRLETKTKDLSIYPTSMYIEFLICIQF